MTLQDEIRLLLQAPMMNTHDVRTQLRLDHDELLQVARDMVDADGGDSRRMLLRRLRPALLVHLQSVRATVYPSLFTLRVTRHASALRDERIADHQDLEAKLTWLAKSRKTESDEWASRAQSLLTMLRRYVQAEQDDVFGLLGQHFDDAALARIAQAFLAEKSRLSVLDGRTIALQSLQEAENSHHRQGSRGRRGNVATNEDSSTGEHSLHA